MSTLGVKDGHIPTEDEVRKHALQLQNDLLDKQGKGGAQSADEARAATAVPSFSKGTVAIDEHTQRPIVTGQDPGQIGGETVKVDGADLGGDPNRKLGGEAAAEAAAGEMLEQTPPEVDPPVAAAPAPVEAPDGGAAEPAAGAIARNWDDYEEIDYDDPEAGQTYKVYATKDQAAAVKGGYARRSIMDRHATYLGQAREVLEPLITDGRIQQVLPLLRAAMEDPEYGQFVVDAFNRRQQGLPLTPAQAAAVAAAPAVAASNDGADYEDPFLKHAIDPLRSELDEIKGIVKSQAQREQEANEQAQMNARAQQEINQMLATTHRDLHTHYPDAFQGKWDADKELIGKIYQYANQAGYFQTYGYTPAAFRLAYTELRAARSEASSPAAAVVNQAAAASAAAPVRSVPTGTAQGGGVTRKAPPAPVVMRRQDGSMISAREFAEQELNRRLTK